MAKWNEHPWEGEAPPKPEPTPRLLGYTPVDADGNPVRATRSAGSWHERKEPVKVYQHIGRAQSLSPIGEAKAVYFQD